MSDLPRILVVEDDADTAREIRTALEAEGCSVVQLANGAEALELATREPFDAITLDRMLPEVDGVTLVSQLRQRRIHAPVLMISAMGEVDERIEGLRAGGDDYLSKPFSPAEMAARVSVLLRRQQLQQMASGGETRFKLGPIEIDLIGRKAYAGGEPVKLLHMEFRLLEFLMRHSGTIISRRLIFEQVWGYHFDPGANLINVHIMRLRKKLVVPGHASPITTVKGEGYRFDAV